MINTLGGDWTRNKLVILKGYLMAYTTVLKNQGFGLWYVDAFAGTGYIKLDSSVARKGALPMLWEEPDTETASVLKGSARVALEVDDKPFDHFIFVDQKENHASQLRELKREFSERDIQIVQGDANHFLQNWCLSRNNQLRTPWPHDRAVVFLDPCAAQVELETVRSISQTKSVDLWIWFPLYALTRNLPVDREPDDGKAGKLNRVFGNDQWRKELYRSHKQMNLFGEEETQFVRDDQKAIVDLYLQKLKDIFPAVSPEPKWFKNSNNAPLFALMFAAANPGPGGRKALEIANHLLTRW